MAARGLEQGRNGELVIDGCRISHQQARWISSKDLVHKIVPVVNSAVLFLKIE